MKRLIKSLVILFAIIVFANCNSNKSEAKAATVSQPQQSPKVETRTVVGTVAEIRNGKDGFTAVIVTGDKENYEAVISHPNLLNPQQFRTYKIHDFITVTGDHWKIKKQNYITVRIIQ